MIRILDTLFALTGLILLSPLMLILYIIGLIDTGSPLFFQARVGKNQQPFTLIKFRTMKPGTASVGTHLVDATAITSFGKFLRGSKLDELPQLWNVLLGQMSLVGPRPNLPGQHELITARDALGVFAARPGITGLAQVQGIDMSTPELLAQTDAKMLKNLSTRHYFTYILQTLSGKGKGDRITH